MGCTDLHDGSAVQLPTTPCLHDAVDQDVTVADDGTGVGTGLGESGELEELAQSDHVAADLDDFWLAHGSSIGSVHEWVGAC